MVGTIQQVWNTLSTGTSVNLVMVMDSQLSMCMVFKKNGKDPTPTGSSCCTPGPEH